ncbi:GNAT family N-acetyltransferase [Akkermansia sp.]|uniref:GNAT family N-acetyltransferase n=1 Tax=Akkermansia sp. TaxID=1872421 RepID=UPI003AB5AFCF
MTAYVYCLLVHPRCQGYGVGSCLLSMCKKHDAEYLSIILTSCREKVSFYERNGFISSAFGETKI